MVSSLTGGSRGGTQESTGAGPRTTSGVMGPTAKVRRPFWLVRTRSSGSSARQRAVEPAGVGTAGPRKAAFQHVLAVEMRALAIGRRHRMHHDGLAGLVEPVQVRHRRVEGEEAVERQPRLGAVELEGVVAAQLDPVGIADRGDGGEPVERAAQHDGEEARIAALGARDFRHERPGEQRTGAEQQLAAGRGMKAGTGRRRP